MIVTIGSQEDLRSRKKIESMRRVQAAALDLFESRGFDGVAIEEIARVAEVGPATIYRNFGTKEGIVLWDEYDPMLLGAIAGTPGPVYAAMEKALTSSLAKVYEKDRARILRRARLMMDTPPLRLAAAENLLQLREGLARVLRPRLRDDLSAQVAAGAAVAAMEAGIDLWLRGRGRQPLARCLAAAFRRLAALA